MIQKRYAVPALILGAAMLGGSSAYAAFGPGAPDASVLAGFTAAQQEAIQKAFTIRQTAAQEAEAVLDAAGVDRKDLHKAMQSFHEKDRAAIEAALDANDYAAFEKAVASRPMADKLTQAVFDKLVQIRKLDAAGDHEGAKALRKTLAADGFTGMGLMMGGRGMHGMGGPGGPDRDADDN